MALTPGAKIGVYEIIARIGVGGMGEVYRATDTTLGRHVAVKILPDAFASDRERLARFEREAKTLASLNHPHIAAIYGFEKSAGMHALVMELVEGPTLANRIAQGPMSLDDALPIARQIAEALESAHEQGIIHRDLKPANIKVRADGTVKVLDFGLAKLAESGEAGSPDRNLTQSPTLTSPAMMTGAGMILGTAAYMSPEQARGKTVDKRADIWAFGAVLFEMLTGRPAFGAGDVADTLAAVLRSDPDWSVLTKAPPELLRLLKRCLERDPSRRIQSAGDLRIRLLEVESEKTVPLSATTPRRWMWALLGASVVAAFFAGGLLTNRSRSTADAGVTLITDIATPPTSDSTSIALSPDGRSIAFVASDALGSRLWVRSLSNETATPLPGTERALSPFWSPNSRTLAFFSDGSLKRIDVDGGRPQIVVNAGVPRGGAWSSEGVILFPRNTTGPLFRVPASGGPAVAATTLGRQTTHRYPSFLPDGRRFIYSGVGEESESGIFLGSLDGRPAKRLVASDTPGVFLAPDVLLWTRQGELVAQRIDLDAEALVGEPLSLRVQVGLEDLSQGNALTVSATGLIAYRGENTSRRRLTWVDRTGKVLGEVGPENEQGFLQPRVSRDGRVAAYRTHNGNIDLWLIEGAELTRFTFDRAQERLPIWSPDGTRIAFDSTRNGPRNLFTKTADNQSPEQLLLKAPINLIPQDWSSDGRFLIYLQNDPETQYDIMALPVDGDPTPFPVVRTIASERGASLSPDGRWLVFHSQASGSPEVWVCRFLPFSSTGGGGGDCETGESQLTTRGGIYPKWSPTGREVYYLAPDGMLMAVPTSTSATGVPQFGTPVPLFDPHIYGGGVENQQARQFDVSPDGRFLINQVVSESTTPIRLIQNWHPPTSAARH